MRQPADPIPRADLPFDPATGDVVCRRDRERPGARRCNVPPRHAHHAPAGAGRGAGAAGDADLALDVLALLLPPPATEGQRVGLRGGSRVGLVAWFLHRDFAREVLARLPAAGGTIPGDLIRSWLRERGEAPR